MGRNIERILDELEPYMASESHKSSLQVIRDSVDSMVRNNLLPPWVPVNKLESNRESNGKKEIPARYEHVIFTYDNERDVIIPKSNPREIVPRKKVSELLKFFIMHDNTVLLREDIYDKVWGCDEFREIRTVDAHVSNLRRNIGELRGEPQYLVSRWGRGYMLINPLTARI